MKTNLQLLALTFLLCINASAFAQYGGGYGGGGYGGGYGRGGYGGGYGAQQMPSTPPKAKTPDQIADDETKWMTKKLNLTEDQSLSVETLNLDFALRMSDFQEIFTKTHPNNMRPSPQEIAQIKETIAKWQAEKETKLKAILTPEQWEIYEKKKKNRPGAY